MSTRERNIAAKATPYTEPPAPSERYRRYEERPLAWADWPEDRGSYVSDKGNPTAKWRGVSINHLRDRAHEAMEAATALRVAHRVAHRARSDYHAEVERVLGIEAEVGFSPCEESLTGTCIYPVIAGEYDDSPECIFCETPKAGEEK